MSAPGARLEPADTWCLGTALLASAASSQASAFCYVLFKKETRLKLKLSE